MSKPSKEDYDLATEMVKNTGGVVRNIEGGPSIAVCALAQRLHDSIERAVKDVISQEVQKGD